MDSGVAASVFWMVHFYGWEKWPAWSKCTILLITNRVSGHVPKAHNENTVQTDSNLSSETHRPAFYRGRDLWRVWTWSDLGSFLTSKEVAKDGS